MGDFWDFYWEVRLRELENLGKSAAIRAASGEIRSLFNQIKRPLRLLELGCGEGQIIGALVSAHTQECDLSSSVGIDLNRQSLDTCRKTYPGLNILCGDINDPVNFENLGGFDVILLVNTLHEIYSATISPVTDEVDVPLAKERVRQVLNQVAGRLTPQGRLILFDGLETPGDLSRPVQIRFKDEISQKEFYQFAEEFRPFKIKYKKFAEHGGIELSTRDFNRYIDKSIFLGKDLWKTERLESYQYFTETEFRAALQNLELKIDRLQTFSVNEEKWRSKVEIISPEVEFPLEHILIIAGYKTSPPTPLRFR